MLQKGRNERTFSDTMSSFVNTRSLRFEYAGVLQETQLLTVFGYVSGIMIWREMEISMIKAVQMDNLSILLGV